MANGGQDALTPREQEVLELVKQRRTNDAIAERLVIDVRTVETHIQNALHKLGYHSRRELWEDMTG